MHHRPGPCSQLSHPPPALLELVHHVGLGLHLGPGIVPEELIASGLKLRERCCAVATHPSHHSGTVMSGMGGTATASCRVTTAFTSRLVIWWPPGPPGRSTAVGPAPARTTAWYSRPPCATAPGRLRSMVE